MNNTAPDLTKENQYEFKCGVCGVTAYGPKGSCACDTCKGRTQSFRALFKDLRWNTHSSCRDAEVAITAMHRAFHLGSAGGYEQAKAEVGPLDDDWPGYHTHFTPHPPIPTF